MTGQTISHYEILDKLGAGGMGVVYKAHDTHLDRFVAIKVLPAEKVANPDRKARFVQEAKSASALNHPNIVTIYDIDQHEGVDFMAMEYVAGKTLDDLTPRKGMRLNEALKLAVQVADALATAHEVGIIHRDIKPGNIMVGDDGRVRVLDFGLAKLSEVVPESDETRTVVAGKAPHTEEGTILGTASYMSPEQAEGKKLDARSDIFSFGSVLYEMITGRRPFVGDSSMSTLAAIIKNDPDELPGDVPYELRKVISRCLRKNPGRRVQTMSDLKVALEDVIEESESGTQTPVATPVRSRWPVLLKGASVAALVLAAAAAGWYWLRPTGPPPAVEESTIVPITSYPGTENGPTLSPDGNQVAFSWDGEAQDNFDIYVKLVDSGRPLRLTDHPASDLYPAWSPDGRQIAFTREGAVFLISPLGGQERKLAEFHGVISFPSWSPDSSTVAFEDRPVSGDTSAITVISVTDGEKRQLTFPPVGFGDFNPVFSPDGSTLAFVRGYDILYGDIFLVPAKGGEPRRLTPSSRRIALPSLAWLPNGRDLVFSRRDQRGWGIWRIRTTDEPPQPQPVVGGIDGRSVSVSGHPTEGDGTLRLAYQRFVGEQDLWRFSVDAHDGTEKATMLADSTRIEYCPRISPDGERMAFISNRSGSSAIWTCDRRGGSLTELARGGGFGFNWSPDGRRIVFVQVKKGNFDIYVIGSDGSSPARLTEHPSSDTSPIWSNDGSHVYFASNRSGTWQIWRLPSEGGKATQVTRNGGFGVQQSPDGKLLYYTRGRLSRGLWSMPSAGGEETMVLDEASEGFWRVTQSGVYFVTRLMQSKFSLHLYRFDTHKVTNVGEFEGIVPPWLPGFEVAPDESEILIALDRSGSDLMLIDNFR